MASHELNYSSSDEKIDMEKGHVVDHDNTAVVPEFEDPNLDKDAMTFEDDSPYPGQSFFFPCNLYMIVMRY